MVVWQTLMRGSVCSRTVRKSYRFIWIDHHINGLLTFGIRPRNQHIIKTSIPTSHAYISPVDRKTPNFVEQFECTSNFISMFRHFNIWASRERYDWLDAFPYCSRLLVSILFPDSLVRYISSLAPSPGIPTMARRGAQNQCLLPQSCSERG